jgi:hypothetical protein
VRRAQRNQIAPPRPPNPLTRSAERARGGEARLTADLAVRCAPAGAAHNWPASKGWLAGSVAPFVRHTTGVSPALGRVILRSTGRVLATVTQWWSQFHLTQIEVSAAGVVGTLWAVIVALRAGGQAEKRWLTDKDERQRAHARLVTVRTDLGTGTEPVAEMAIRNDGPESILTAGIADVQPRPEGTSVTGHLQLGPVADRPTVGVIRPLEEAKFFVHCLDAEGNRVPWPEGRRRVEIQFMDAQGKSWRRVNYDEPELIERVKWEPR